MRTRYLHAEARTGTNRSHARHGGCRSGKEGATPGSARRRGRFERRPLGVPRRIHEPRRRAGRPWNIFLGSDLNSIDRALKRAFARCRIDPHRIAVGGFSDGATTALSIGLLNGDLFRAVMAIAPGGLIAEKPVGKPRVYMAHGTRDIVLPTRISDAVARLLRSSGYLVTLRKFKGGHEVPYGISKAAIRWFLAS